MTATITSPHLFNLGTIKPQKITPGGSRADAKVEQLPILKGMSLSLLILNPKGVREPHWHPNANELSYCIEGNALITIFSPNAGHDTFTVKAGEIAFVPMGYLHHIENIGDTPLKMLVCFDNENAEDLSLSASSSVMPQHILADTFNQKNSFFAGLHKSSAEGVFISMREKAAIPPMPFMTSRYKFDLEGMNPQITTKGGSVKLSNVNMIPPLEGLAVYGVCLKKGGAREPHWHPNASELNYLLRGSARITLLSPGGHVDTFDMQPGDMSFLPQGYVHHIENTGSEDARFAIFFNNVMPSDIGLSGCFGAYSNEVLASLFGVSPSYFDNFPKYQEDLFVVSGAG
jgi:oxalate decarboxylase